MKHEVLLGKVGAVPSATQNLPTKMRQSVVAGPRGCRVGPATQEFPMQSKGWLVPSNLRHPLDVAVLRDDTHFIATLDGHPQIEAVEAMIRSTGAGRVIVRAIVTMHDQSQIDYTNDAAIHAATTAVARQSILSDIDLSLERDHERVKARVAFQTYAGERIELVFVAIGLPSKERGGLTDPGQHSRGSSLPIMWRTRSTVGTDGTHVLVGARRYEAVIVHQIGPGRSIRKAYYTEGHVMAVIRAGRRRVAVTGKSSGFDDLQRITSLAFSSSDGTSEFLIEFEDGGFQCHLDAGRAVVVGEAWTEVIDDALRLHLVPTAPLWAGARAVVAEVSRHEGAYEVETTVGGPVQSQLGVLPEILATESAARSRKPR